MKFLLATTLAVSVLASGAIATAAGPYGCSTGYGSNTSQYSYGNQYGYGTQLGYGTQSAYGYQPSYAPQYGYGAVQNYGGYQNFQSYPQSSQYGQSWNTSQYRTPSYTYDPVHGDYHLNTVSQTRPYNQGFGGHHSAYGYQYGGNRGW